MNKVYCLLLFFIFSVANGVKSDASALDSIKNFFSQEYEERSNPAELHKEIIKDFLDEEYSSVVDKVGRFKKFHSFYPNIKKILILEILSAYLGKKYEIIDVLVDKFIDVYEGDEDIFYVLYIKALSLRAMAKNSKTNIGIATDALNLFRLLNKRVLKQNEARASDSVVNYSFRAGQDYGRFKAKIILNIEALSALLAQSNFDIAEYYLSGGYYISALHRNLFVIADFENIYTPKDKSLAFENINKIFNKIYGRS